MLRCGAVVLQRRHHRPLSHRLRRLHKLPFHPRWKVQDRGVTSPSLRRAAKALRRQDCLQPDRQQRNRLHQECQGRDFPRQVGQGDWGRRFPEVPRLRLSYRLPRQSSPERCPLPGAMPSRGHGPSRPGRPIQSRCRLGEECRYSQGRGAVVHCRWQPPFRHHSRRTDKVVVRSVRPFPLPARLLGRFRRRRHLTRFRAPVRRCGKTRRAIGRLSSK
jgi:hypothetical protein